MKDILGKALLDFQTGNYSENIITSTSISDKDVLPLPYMFRTYIEMPVIEQRALQISQGKILDVGCGSGNHSLFLKNKGLEVKPIDISKGAVKVCQLRGLEQAQVLDVMDETDKFDTILLLMNGAGVLRSLEKAPRYLDHLKKLLNAKGQILMDSSDIKYMYEDDDGGIWIDLHSNYYGELQYKVSYKGEEESFPWMYLDFETLGELSRNAGFNCELEIEGDHFDFLARLTLA